MEKLQEVLDKIEINTRSTAQWALFRGVLTIFGLIGGALGLIYVLNH